MIRVVLAFEQRLLRAGLRALLEAQPDVTVVGETGIGSKAVEHTDSLRPDVLMFSDRLPELTGLDSARRLERLSPRTRRMVVSRRPEEGTAVEALRCGAAGFLSTDSAPAEMIAAVRSVATGQTFLAPPLDRKPLEYYLTKSRALRPDPYSRLTTRERQVLQLAADGLTSNSIADRLSISGRTVETHRSNAMRKLGLSGPADLIRYSIARGLISADPPSRNGSQAARNGDSA